MSFDKIFDLIQLEEFILIFIIIYSMHNETEFPNKNDVIFPKILGFLLYGIPKQKCIFSPMTLGLDTTGYDRGTPLSF